MRLMTALKDMGMEGKENDGLDMGAEKVDKGQRVKKGNKMD